MTPKRLEEDYNIFFQEYIADKGNLVIQNWAGYKLAGPRMSLRAEDIVCEDIVAYSRGFKTARSYHLHFLPTSTFHFNDEGEWSKLLNGLEKYGHWKSG